jgi:DNA-directed RNA polymerase subunit RPC12/RpoP
MEMKTIKCSECGASIEVDGSIGIIQCEYCGSTIAINGCETLNTNKPQAKKDYIPKRAKNKIEIIKCKFIREKSLKNTAYTVGISIDGNDIAHLASGKTEIIKIEKGTHDVTFEALKAETIETELYFDTDMTIIVNLEGMIKRKIDYRIIKEH